MQSIFFLLLKSHTISDENNTENFVCNFCCTSFVTMNERDQHLETHLIRQNCSSCKKSMILIGNQLYELHIPSKCKNELNYHVDRSIEPEQSKVVTRPKRPRRNVKPLAENKNEDIENSNDTQVLSNYECMAADKNVNPVKLDNNQEIKIESCDDKKDEKIVEEHPSSEVQVPVQKSEENVENRNEKPKPRTRKKSEKKTECKTYKKKYPKTIPCDMCDKLFGVEQSLIIHQKKEHNKMPVYKCDICGMILKTALYLKNHIAIHKGEKRYRNFVFLTFNCELR